MDLTVSGCQQHSTGLGPWDWVHEIGCMGLGPWTSEPLRAFFQPKRPVWLCHMALLQRSVI